MLVGCDAFVLEFDGGKMELSDQQFVPADACEHPGESDGTSDIFESKVQRELIRQGNGLLCHRWFGWPDDLTLEANEPEIGNHPKVSIIPVILDCFLILFSLGEKKQGYSKKKERQYLFQSLHGKPIRYG